MEKIRILGNQSLRLKGKVKISGSKNAGLPAIAASLLTEERLHLDNIPRVKDVFTILTLMEELGARSKLKDNSLTIRARRIISDEAAYELVPKMALFGRERVEQGHPVTGRRGARCWAPSRGRMAKGSAWAMSSGDFMPVRGGGG